MLCQLKHSDTNLEGHLLGIRINQFNRFDERIEVIVS
jgi:hypothetical protein